MVLHTSLPESLAGISAGHGELQRVLAEHLYKPMSINKTSFKNIKDFQILKPIKLLVRVTMQHLILHLVPYRLHTYWNQMIGNLQETEGRFSKTEPSLRSKYNLAHTLTSKKVLMPLFLATNIFVKLYISLRWTSKGTLSKWQEVINNWQERRGRRFPYRWQVLQDDDMYINIIYQLETLPLYAALFYDALYCSFCMFLSVLGVLSFQHIKSRFPHSPDSLYIPIFPCMLFSAALPTNSVALPSFIPFQVPICSPGIRASVGQKISWYTFSLPW